MFRHTVLTSNLVIYYIWRPSGALGCIILKLPDGDLAISCGETERRKRIITGIGNFLK